MPILSCCNPKLKSIFGEIKPLENFLRKIVALSRQTRNPKKG